VLTNDCSPGRDSDGRAVRTTGNAAGGVCTISEGAIRTLRDGVVRCSRYSGRWSMICDLVTVHSFVAYLWCWNSFFHGVILSGGTGNKEKGWRPKCVCQGR